MTGEFGVESVVLGAGKVGSKREVQVGVKCMVGDIVRTVGDCSEDFGLEGLDFLDVRRFSTPPDFYAVCPGRFQY